MLFEQLAVTHSHAVDRQSDHAFLRLGHCNEHGEFEKNLWLRFEPALRVWVSVLEFFLVLDVPVIVELRDFICPVERAGEVLDRLAEFNTAEIRVDLFLCAVRARDDLLVCREDESRATCVSCTKNVLLHEPFHTRRSETCEEVDARVFDEVNTFVLCDYVNYGSVPDCSEEVQKPERIHSDEVDEFGSKD